MPGLPDNPISSVIVALLYLLLGGGAAGTVVALRKDRRLGNREDVDLTVLVKKVAEDTIESLRGDVTRLRKELDDERAHAARELAEVRAQMMGRVAQLENVIRAMGGTVPPWLN